MTGFQDTPVGPLPSSWTFESLGDLFAVSAGGDWDAKNSAKTRDADHPYPVFANAMRPGAVQGYCSYYTVPGDTLSITGRGDVGHAIYRDQAYVPIVRLLSLIPKRELSSRYFTEYINERVRFSLESTGVPQLTAPQIRPYLMAVPPLEEQLAIEQALQDVDGLISTIESLIAKKHAIKTGMMQQLLTGKMRMPGFDVPWKTITLGNHVNYVKNVALSRAQLDESSMVKYLHYGDIHTTKKLKINPSVQDMPRAKAELLGTARFLVKGDLVFADASEDPAGVGKSVEIVDVPENGVVPGLHTITARFDKTILADGFKAYLQFIPAFRDQLLRLAAGTKVLATNRSNISGIEIDLPGIKEQQAIARILDDADAEISALESRLEKAKAIKQGMMQELLTGKTRLVGEVVAS